LTLQTFERFLSTLHCCSFVFRESTASQCHNHNQNLELKYKFSTGDFLYEY
jgi:hypothetical protein